MRSRLRARLRGSVERLRVSAAPILQCGAAAGVAWFVANDLVGHQRPFFAPIAAVISLGVSLRAGPAAGTGLSRADALTALRGG